MKIKEPIIKTLESKDIDLSIKENNFTNNLYIYNNENNLKIKDTELNSCKFINFDYKLIHRTQFKNCNLIGTTFIDTSLKDIIIEESNLQYVNFSGSKLSNIILEKCNLNESSFLETKLKNIEFNNCSLHKAEIFNTSLKDIDLSTCDITQIIIDNNSIKNLIIEPNQAIDLINMLGVKIKR